MDFDVDLEDWKILLNVPDTAEFSVITGLDLPNQRVITSDVDRTRSGLLTETEKIQLELLLTYYCKEYNTFYKQGMNEIMAPFLLMNRVGLPIHMVYLFFKSFIHTYLPSMFVDHQFRPLQALFLLFRLLLRYFEPRISSFFLSNSITPELFGTSWFLTLYASKINNIKVLYKLWQDLMIEKDVIFPLFIGIALLQHFKSEIVKGQDLIIPHTISQIFLDNMEILLKIVEKARALKEKMPYSMLMQISKYDIYNLDTIDLLIKSLEKEVCLSILPREILHRSYPEVKLCYCKDSKCPWCSSRGHSVPLVLLDCRTEDEHSSGIFPNSVLLKSQAYCDTEFMMDFPDQFIPMRGLFHFCFMGSRSFNSDNFNLAISNHKENDIVQNMVENLLQVFLMKGFPFLSVLEGGFEKCHEFARHFKIEIENHEKNYCLVCNPNSWKLKSKKKPEKSEKNEEKVAEEIKVEQKDDIKSVEKELVNSNGIEMTGYEAFFCKKWEGDKASDDDYCIKIGNIWFEVENIQESEEEKKETDDFLDFQQDFDSPKTEDEKKNKIKEKISTIDGITILKKNPLLLSFKFKDSKVCAQFLMRSSDEAKKCVGQVTKFLAEYKPNFNKYQL